MLFRRVPEHLRPLLLAEFLPVEDPVAELAASFDFVLSPSLAQPSPPSPTATSLCWRWPRRC
jgi:hypothetical protein